MNKVLFLIINNQDTFQRSKNYTGQKKWSVKNIKTPIGMTRVLRGAPQAGLEPATL